MVDALELPIAVQSCRAEQVLEDFRFDSVVARAVGSLRKVLPWFAPHWASIGRLLLIKGPRWTEERGEARHRGLMKSLELRRVAHYPLVGTESESVILQITHSGRKCQLLAQVQDGTLFWIEVFVAILTFGR